MKLDDLRARLRKARAEQKPKSTATGASGKKPRLRCSKCRKPREPAQLSDPDVAEIVAEQRKVTSEKPLGAYRCRACGIIWIGYEGSPSLSLPPTHSRCRSS